MNGMNPFFGSKTALHGKENVSEKRKVGSTKKPTIVVVLLMHTYPAHFFIPVQCPFVQPLSSFASSRTKIGLLPAVHRLIKADQSQQTRPRFAKNSTFVYNSIVLQISWTSIPATMHSNLCIFAAKAVKASIKLDLEKTPVGRIAETKESSSFAYKVGKPYLREIGEVGIWVRHSSTFFSSSFSNASVQKWFLKVSLLCNVSHTSIRSIGSFVYVYART